VVAGKKTSGSAWFSGQNFATRFFPKKLKISARSGDEGDSFAYRTIFLVISTLRPVTVLCVIFL
jgi:hypothetical protein